MERILLFLKRIIPVAIFKRLQPFYHYFLNYVAALWYRHPSEEMTVIGVTGTTGKTTVVYMIAQMLAANDITVGYTSTAMFGDGKRQWLNDKKMTMLGRFFTQKMLRSMVRNGCSVAIVETTSEGARQFRHRFINYDVFVFTGLYPEHIDSHGSFENYKNAKLSLFSHLENSSSKKNISQPKTIIVNGDDEHASDFLDFQVPRKVVFTKENVKLGTANTEYIYYSVLASRAQGLQMGFDTTDISLALLGDFTVINAAAAGSVGRVLGLDGTQIAKGLASVEGIPGRLERIDSGQDFSVIVDYAFEPVAVAKLYETIGVLGARRIIHVLGSTGGGRDLSRRRELGLLAGKLADVVIVTNEDPYDDPPMEIIQDVASGVLTHNKIEGENLFLIEDRRAAIEKALSTAQTGDVVLVTGKGSEQAIAVASGAKIPWDDRRVVREILDSLS